MLDSWEKVIDPNFINSELIGTVGAEKVVTITNIDFAECYDEQTKQKVQKQTVFFEECKPLVLNKTNAKTLKRLFSPNSDNPADAVGHKVILRVESIKAPAPTAPSSVCRQTRTPCTCAATSAPRSSARPWTGTERAR